MKENKPVGSGVGDANTNPNINSAINRINQYKIYQAYKTETEEVTFFL